MVSKKTALPDGTVAKSTAAIKPDKAPDPKKPVMAHIEVGAGDVTSGYYSNYAEVTHSGWDFVLSFARIATKYPPEQIQAIQSSGKIVVDPLVQVTLPPKVAKGLIVALQKQCDSYEKMFGTIKLDEGDKK